MKRKQLVAMLLSAVLVTGTVAGPVYASEGAGKTAGTGQILETAAELEEILSEKALSGEVSEALEEEIAELETDVEELADEASGETPAPDSEAGGEEEAVEEAASEEAGDSASEMIADDAGEADVEKEETASEAAEDAGNASSELEKKEDTKSEETPSVTEEKEDSSSGQQAIPEESESEKKTDHEKTVEEETSEDLSDTSSEKSGAETRSGEKKEKADPSDVSAESAKEDSREETVEESAERAVELIQENPEAEPVEETVSEEPVSAADSYPVILPGKWTTVTVTEEEPEARFLFTAEEAGKYYFYSAKEDNDDPDTLGIIYDLEEYELDRNAWGADEGNFKVTFEAEPGESVILGARFYDEYKGSFKVIVEKEPAIVSLSAVAQKVVLEGTDCSYEYGEDGHEWFYYDPYVFEPVFTVVTETGERTGTADELYYGYGYEIELSAEQSEETAWGVGTHTVTATLNGVSCEFEVEIGESSAFEQTAEIDGLTVKVTAERGCFPQDAVLTAESISGTEKEQFRSRAENCHYDEMFRISDYAFRLSVTDGSGNVLLPPDGYAVNIFVNGAETAESNLTPRLYGFKGNDEEKEYWLEQLDETYKTEMDVYYPAYYLEFTYGKLTYSLKSGTSVKLSSLIEDTGLSGTVTNVVCSNTDLLSASEENGEWSLTSLQPFNFEEWIKVTLNGLEYQIFISDADVIASGTLDSGVRWILNSDGLMSITGSGSMGDLWDNPWWDYRDEINTIIIQEGVTDIGDRAFCECANLTSVSVPGSVAEIGYDAFSSCPKLQTVVLSEGLKTIGDRAFSQDSSLDTITLPGTVTSLGSTFIGGTAVSSITIPAKVTYAIYALADAMNLDEVIFAEGTTKIPGSLFGGSYVYASKITIPEGVKVIGDRAFENCASLESIELPESLETIENNAFSESGLKTITLPAAVKWIDEEAFSKCVSLTTVTMTDNDTQIRTPEGWKLYFLEIKYNAFENCTALTTVSFSKNVTKIDNNSFNGCRSLANLDLPVNLEYLGWGAFQGTKIASVVIPASLTDISDNAFYGATYLETVSFAEGTVRIPNYCFSSGDGISYIKNVILPDSLTEIGSHAFYSNENLEEINIPVNVSKIGSCAFEDCPKLVNVSLSENNSIIRTEEGDVPFSLEIENHAFANCGSLADLELPQSVSYIGECAFANTGLSTISLGQNLREIGESFISGTKISSVTVPAGVTDANGAFENTASLQEVVFADGTVTIPYGICKNYEGRTRITSVIIPEGVKTIRNYAFEKCTRLTSVNIPKSVSEIEQDAFSGCDLLLYVYKNSYAELWAIEHDFMYQYLSGDTGDDDDRVLDMTASAYYTNADVTSINSYIPLYLKYKIKKADQKLVSNKRLTFRLSSSLDLVDGTVCMDDEPYSDYYLDDWNNEVTIDLENDQYEGNVLFYVRPVSVGRIASYATLSYYMGSGSYTEVIGTISLEVPVLTMQVPAKTSSTAFEVSGLTEPKEKVNLYIDGKKVSTVTARKDGAYAATLTISGTPVNGKTYSVKAVLNKDSDIFTSSTIVYQENVPELLSFEMYYNNGGSAMIDLLETKGARQTISYAPGTPLTFKIRFSNAEQLKKVYVGSAKGVVEKRMQARPSGKTGEYVASGFFDPNDLNYLPGTVFVLYQTASTFYESIGEVDFETEVSDTWKDPIYEREVNDDVNGNYKGNVTNRDGDTVHYEIRTGTPDDIAKELMGDTSGYDTSSGSSVIGSYGNLIGSNPDYYIIAQTDDALIYQKNDSEIGYIFTQNNGRKLVSEIIKGPVDKGLKEIFSNCLGLSSAEAGGIASYIAGIGNAIYCGHNTYVDINKARSEIAANSSLTAAQKKDAYDSLDRMENANRALSAFRLINTGIKAGLVITGHPVLAACYGVLGNMLESIGQSYIDESIKYAKEGKSYYLKWLIDPSGYVYEAVTDNYIENATVTAWFKENESAVPVIWDAEEDGQVNPLSTDSKGFYAWDTPEGLWQVVVEKAGYETWTSEWLTVPPIQTDVNAALISVEDPFVEWVEADENQVQIQFSQFMDPESVGGIKVKNSSGQEMNYNLVYDTSRTSAEGKVYADYYSFQFTGNKLSEGERCTIVVPEEVKNYAGKEAAAEEIRTFRSVNRVLTVQEEAEAAYTKTTVIPVTVTNSDDMTTVSADSTAPLIAKVVSVEKAGNDTWLVTVYGALPGTADILISLNNSAVSKAVAFTVTNDGQAQDTVEVESITITADKQQIPAGGTVQLTANVLPENASDKTVIWAVDKSSVAAIDSSGLLTGLHEGVAQIVARAMVGNAVAVYTVTVGESHSHTLEQVAAAAATLEAAGNIAYYRCTGCSRLFSDAAGENEIRESDTVIAKLIDLGTAEVTGIEDKTYNGKAQTQDPAVVVDGTALTKGTDYTLSYKNNVNAGTATVTIKGKGLYGGSLSRTFRIRTKSISAAEITLSATSYTYNGTERKPSVTAVLAGTELKEGTDFTVSYSSNINAGTAAATITGKGNYTGTAEAAFKINKAEQSITVKTSAASVAVGKTVTVSITGAKGEKSCKSSSTTIATVTNAGKVTAKKVGEVTITASSGATANYKAASKTVKIKVVPAATTSLTAANQAAGIKLTWKKVTGATGYKVYRGSTLVKTITKGSTVTFTDKKANTNGSKYTFKVIATAATGASTLSKTVIAYRVARPAISSAANSAAGKMTVKWGKNAKATGYQIQYSTSKTFASGNKTVSVTSASTVSKAITGLKKGKTYYIRIRTYKSAGSQKYWSAWSAAKTLKITK